MSEELTPLQREAFEVKEKLCEGIADHGCGGCPLDKIRREKNVSCDKVCLYYPMLVVEAVTERKNDAEQPKATSREGKADWEADAKRLQKEKERLQIELNAERQRNVQLEKDLQVAREEVAKKDKLKERITGRYEAYREMLVMVLDRNGGKDGN